MEAPDNWMWLAFMIVLIVIEAMTISLTTLWFAIGALVAFLLGLFGVPFVWQLIAFFVVSTVLIVFTRPLALKALKVGKTKTNVDSLAGREGVVISDISEFATGQVKLGGQVWSALPYDGATILEGAVVTVVSVEGVKLIVKPIATEPHESM